MGDERLAFAESSSSKKVVIKKFHSLDKKIIFNGMFCKCSKCTDDLLVFNGVCNHGTFCEVENST